MNAIELRYKLIQFIAKVEDSKLKEIEALLYSTLDYEIPEEDKAILNERIAEYEANPQNVALWDDLMAEFDAKYGI